jgi:hypothetical protein
VGGRIDAQSIEEATMVDNATTAIKAGAHGYDYDTRKRILEGDASELYNLQF